MNRVDGLIVPGVHVPEHLPGEPDRRPASTPRLAVTVALRLVTTLILALITVPLWPLYGLGLAVYGRPPNVPRASQVRRYLRLAWTERPTSPGIRPVARAYLTLAIVRKALTTPIFGLAWQLDELLYGRALAATPVVAPLIEISAGRSGSTQLARYLEEDPHLAAPGFLQLTFPYLWLWRLVPATLGRIVSADTVRHRFEAMLPPEFLQRHEADPFRTDTFESTLYLAHLNHLSVFLGPDVMVDDFGFGVVAPHNRELWNEAFVDLLEGVGRKTVLHAGPGPDGRPRRFFVKGHFLGAAPALERRFPDARFVTMIREPLGRLQSGLNYLRANPVDPLLGPTPWTWLAAAIVRTEVDYGDVELDWYQRPGATRCVLRFADYVRDLEGTMATLYRVCLDTPELPAWVPRTHPPRERTRYLLNRSLADVGVDEAALAARTAAYAAWCRPSSS